MIPLRDTTPSRNYPVVNNLIIGANVLIYLVEMGHGPNLGRFIFTYGLVPARYSIPEISSYFSTLQQVLSLFSFMFLHGGFWHLLGNMWSLYIFGDNVENKLGPLRYLIFYFFCGWASGLSHLVTNWYSEVPTIGASGAIAGVMGAYLILFPRSRILTLIPIFFIPYFVEIPAFFFLGLWFLLQFMSALGSSGQSAGIAWWAHIGGFLFGILLLKLFSRIPETGVSRPIRHTTLKGRSPRLHVVRSSGPTENANLYGQITISALEAKRGTRKLVTVPWALQRRLIRVTVPPGVAPGTLLRLAGLGKSVDGGGRGDLYLRVLIED
ncbi:MAG: rhomboid family intramembrane serine protease [Deltaproteobacteria bacterium]|nr:rhomboid family intramembrane serine protease [Deltaproteobacteria bacterium]